VKRRIVLLGPPASGKGTLADALHSRFGIPVAAPGAILRIESESHSPLGLRADALTRAGRLVDDETINSVVRAWLIRQDGHGFIFDGYPRTLGQAEALDAMLAERGAPLEVALLLGASLPTLRQRVERRATCSACGYIVSVGLHIADTAGRCPRCGGAWSRRADDTTETLEHRFREYQEKTAPVAGYYEKRGLLHHLPTERAPEEVLAAALEILN
jgi:adenylate kinase